MKSTSIYLLGGAPRWSRWRVLADKANKTCALNQTKKGLTIMYGRLIDGVLDQTKVLIVVYDHQQMVYSSVWT